MTDEWITLGEGGDKILRDNGDSSVWDPSPLSVMERLLNNERNHIDYVIDELIDEVDWESYNPNLYRNEWGRIIRSPLKRKGHVTVDVCTPYGTISRSTLSKASLNYIPSLYTALKKSTWGGLHPILPKSGQGSGISDHNGSRLRDQKFMMSNRSMKNKRKVYPESVGVPKNSTSSSENDEDDLWVDDDEEGDAKRNVGVRNRLRSQQSIKRIEHGDKANNKNTTKASIDSLMRYAAHLKRKASSKNANGELSNDVNADKRTGRTRLKIATSLEAHRRRRDLTKQLQEKSEKAVVDEV